MNEIAIMFFGNAAAQRTEAEIYWESGPDRELVAVVFEDKDGWHTFIENERKAAAIGSQLDEAIANAKLQLASYINRTGANPPDGLTGAGLSLWLMEKSDGTAMGYPV